MNNNIISQEYFDSLKLDEIKFPYSSEHKEELEHRLEELSNDSFENKTENKTEKDIIRKDYEIAKEINITFATVLDKDVFVSLFLDICNEGTCSNYIINDIINMCIEQSTYRSINCLIWMLYAGYINTNAQFNQVKEYIESFNHIDSNIDDDKILKLIEDCKNKKINNDYYKSLLKVSNENFDV